jgi:hypothetical protein
MLLLNTIRYLSGLAQYSLLIPLNICRKKNLYKSWECDHDRHVYEKSVHCFMATPNSVILTILFLRQLSGVNMMSELVLLLCIVVD